MRKSYGIDLPFPAFPDDLKAFFIQLPGSGKPGKALWPEAVVLPGKLQ
jgi:hypothetical protein